MLKVIGEEVDGEEVKGTITNTESHIHTHHLHCCGVTRYCHRVEGDLYLSLGHYSHSIYLTNECCWKFIHLFLCFRAKKWHFVSPEMLSYCLLVRNCFYSSFSYTLLYLSFRPSSNVLVFSFFYGICSNGKLITLNTEVKWKLRVVQGKV